MKSKSAVRSALALLVIIATLSVASVPAVADDPAPRAGIASSPVTLREGDRGPAVAAVQRKLRLSADGVFGPQTDRAVRRFQRRRGLDADGIVGPITRRALGLRRFSRASVRHPRRASKRTSRSRGGSRLPHALVKIAECESGGNPRAVSRNGRYRGKYQFLRSTWKANGGRTRDPADASEAHQDQVALRLYRARGTAPWANCA